MSKSTTIINNMNGDRVMKFNISNHNYLIFTISHRNLVIVEMSDPAKPILLLNRMYYSQSALNNGFDKIILAATKAVDTDDFVSIMDTYIDLHNSIHNETTDEIINICKIISEND